MKHPTDYYHQIKDSDIAKRMMSGAFWSFSGTALGKFCVFLTGILCARILGKEQFGELGMVRSTIGMFIILGAGGIGVTATRFISSYRRDQKNHAASIYRLSSVFSLFLGVLVTFLLFVSVGFLAEVILQSPRLAFPLTIGCLILFLSILNSSENGTLAGLEDFRSIALNTFIGSVVESICMVVGAWLYQIEGAIAGFGIGVLALYLCNKLSVIKGLRKSGIRTNREPIYKEDWKLIYQYSIPATLSALSVTPVFWLIRSMLVRSNDYGELGTFEAADQWKIILLFIPGAICQIVLPIMSSITESRTFRRTLLGNIALIGGIATVLVIISWLLAPVIMLLYGKAFTDYTPFVFLAISTIPTALAQILEMTLYSRDKIWTCFGFNIIWGIATFCFSYLFLRNNQGASGIALAVLLAYLLKMICMGGYLFIQQKGGAK